MPVRRLLAFLLCVLSVQVLAGPPAAGRNLFQQFPGKSPAEIDARFDAVWSWNQAQMQQQTGPRRSGFAWPCTFAGRHINAGTAESLLRQTSLKPATAELSTIFDLSHRQIVFAPTHDGRPLSEDPSNGLAAMTAVARPFVQQLWDAPIATGRWRYYDGLLQLLALLQVSGRFNIHAPAL